MNLAEALDLSKKLGLVMTAPSPGWTLEVQPVGLAPDDLLDGLRENKDAIMWGILRSTPVPMFVERWILDEAPDPTTMDRLARAYFTAESLVSSDDVEAFRKAAIEFRGILYCATQGAEKHERTEAP